VIIQKRPLAVIGRILAWGEAHFIVVTAVFLIAIAGIGWAAHSAFGVSEDEPAVLKFGMDTLLYVLRYGPKPTVVDWRFYNPVVQEALATFIYLFRITAIRDVWLVSHYTMFLVFVGGVAAYLALARRITGSIWWALLGGIWLVCTPRVFAHAFVNPKDIPALTFFAWSVVTLVRVIERPTWIRVLLHSLACAVSVSVRTFGLIVPVLTVLHFIVEATPLSRQTLRTLCWQTARYSAAVTVCLFAIWPALWGHPFQMLMGAILDNSSRSPSGNLYMGTMTTTQLPWHYLPVWMGITIPLLYTACFVVGITVTLRYVITSPVAAVREQPVPLIALVWLILPVGAQIIFHIGIFDEWRHLLFIYPAFLLLSLVGVAWLCGRPSTAVRVGAAAVVLFGTLSPAIWMWQNNGIDEMYFSVPSRFVVGRFAGDYWNLSYRQGLEWVLAHDPRPHLVIYGVSKKVFDSANTLEPESRSRIETTRDSTGADYILDNYSSTGYQPTLPDSELVHEIDVDGIRVLGIYEGRRSYSDNQRHV
jgi:hypothetical protein